MVWEVFVDGGGLGHELLNYDNVEVCVFSKEDGWDFDQIHIIEEFVEKMRSERRDHVWFAPPCKKWIQMQELNIAQGQEERLMADRRRLEATHLRVTREAYDEQQKSGRHAYVEHPMQSRMWRNSLMMNSARTGFGFGRTAFS